MNDNNSEISNISNREIQFQHLPKSIKDLFSKEEFFKILTLKKIKDNWEALVGNLLADHSFPKDYYEDSLIVVTTHPAYSQEILFHSHKILDFLKKKTNLHSIKKIHCSIGQIPIKKKKFTSKKEGSLDGKDHLLYSIQGLEDADLKSKLVDLIKVLD